MLSPDALASPHADDGIARQRHSTTLQRYTRMWTHVPPLQPMAAAGRTLSVWLRVCREPPSVTGNPWPLQFFTPMCRQPSQPYHSPPFSHSICLRASFSSISCHERFISSRLPTEKNPTTEKTIPTTAQQERAPFEGKENARSQ